MLNGYAAAAAVGRRWACVCVLENTANNAKLCCYTKNNNYTHTNLISGATSSFLCLCLLLYMCVCVYVTAAAVTTTNTAAVRGWARVQRGGIGRGEELREAQLSGVPLRDCVSYINMNIFLPFSFYKLIHKLSTATTAT